MCPRLSDKRGFSLLEISIAALLLVGVIAGLYSAFATAHRWIQPLNSAAHGVARERLESLHESVRQDRWALAGEPLSDRALSPDGSVEVDGVIYNRQYSVTSVDADNDGTQDYRRVQVTVSWN